MLFVVANFPPEADPPSAEFVLFKRLKSLLRTLSICFTCAKGIITRHLLCFQVVMIRKNPTGCNVNEYLNSSEEQLFFALGKSGLRGSETDT